MAIVKEANVPGVTDALVPMPTAIVVPLSKPTPPPLAPPTMLAVPEDVPPTAIGQVVTTVNTDGIVLPWQIETESNPPAAMATGEGVPPVTVNAGVIGCGFTMSVYEVRSLMQPAVERQRTPYTNVPDVPVPIVSELPLSEELLAPDAGKTSTKAVEPEAQPRLLKVALPEF